MLCVLEVVSYPLSPDFVSDVFLPFFGIGSRPGHDDFENPFFVVFVKPVWLQLRNLIVQIGADSS